MNKRTGIYFWLGMTLSSMFFYPLIASLNESPYYLNWKPLHTLEFLLAWLGISILFTIVLWFSLKKTTTRIGVPIIFTVSLLPFASMGVHVCRQLRLENDLIALAGNPVLYVFIFIALLWIVVIILHPKMDRRREKIRSFYFIFLLIISPLTLISVYAVIKSSFYIQMPAGEYLNGSSSSLGNKNEDPSVDSIYIVLFDEMSYEYLYENDSIKKSYPNIRAFASLADNFHYATAPGDETQTSIPALLLGKNNVEVKVIGNDIFMMDERNKLTPLMPSSNSLFSMAKSIGYRTAMYGDYHQYCKIFKDVVDDCKSFSIYNYADSNGRFSILNPILTTFILWPYIYPFGHLKNPANSVLHKKSVENIYDLGVKALSRSEPSFIFLHFGIPHVPFVFDADGFKPAPEPFLQNAENYIRQLKYVDRLFGNYLKEIKARAKFNNSTIILMSETITIEK